jgi:hypothetical protein
MPEPSQRPVNSQLSVPRVVHELVCALGLSFGVNPCSLAPVCFGVIAGALGKSFLLNAPVWPGPISPAFHFCLADETQGQIGAAVEFILAPLRRAQDARLGMRTEAGLQTALEKLKFLERKQAQNQNPYQYCEERAELEQQLKPLMMVADPGAGELAKAMEDTADRSLLAIYTETGVNQLIEAADGKAAIDLQLLECGWTGTTLAIAGSRSVAGRYVVGPAVTGVFIAAPETIRRLLRNVGPKLKEKLLCSTALPVPRQPGAKVALPNRGCLEAWSQFIARLVSVRSFGQQELTFSISAWETMEQFWNDLPGMPAALAAKLAMSFEAIDSGQPVSLSAHAMQDGAVMARALLGFSAHFQAAKSCSNPSDLDAEEARMLGKIRAAGRIRRRALFRTYASQKSAVLQPILDRLLAKEKVRQSADGFCEEVGAIPSGGERDENTTG